MALDIDVRSITGRIGQLAWIGVRSFVTTLALMSLAGVVLAALSYWWLADLHWIYGTIGALVAVVESVSAGVALGIKRAVAMVAANAFGSLRIGRTILHPVFERMLGVNDGSAAGERGGAVVQRIERSPLAQAEASLSRALGATAGDVETRGWLQRVVKRRLVRLVKRVTLARFRDEQARHADVDLLKVRDELVGTVDDALARKTAAGMRLWTALALAGLPTVVFAQTWLILVLATKGKTAFPWLP